MHNNSPPISRKFKPPQAFYTVVEAAVLWARAEGANTANHPLINKYTQAILDAFKNDTLTPIVLDSNNLPTLDQNPSFSSSIAFDDLKQWFIEHHPKSQPSFLFGK